MSENETGEREKSKKSPQIRECSQQAKERMERQHTELTTDTDQHEKSVKKVPTSTKAVRMYVCSVSNTAALR